MIINLLVYAGKGFLVLIGILGVTVIGMLYHDHLTSREEYGISKLTVFFEDIFKCISILIGIAILAFLGWLVS